MNTLKPVGHARETQPAIVYGVHTMHAPRIASVSVITAFEYADDCNVDRVLRLIADHLIANGVTVAGLLQINHARAGRLRCHMILEELESTEQVVISEDRGPQARGCMLDRHALLRAEALALRALARQPDLLIVNKFGKAEVEGGGFRSVIADALMRLVPVLIAVPQRNLEQWHAYADQLSIDHAFETLEDNVASLCHQLGFDRLIEDAFSARRVEQNSVSSAIDHRSAAMRVGAE
jgi:nucleoside-triphosphatase THEP1